jgi:hypothetical protein
MNMTKNALDACKNKYAKIMGHSSRLEGLKLSVDNMIQKMIVDSPNARVGLVTFADNVELIGDGSQSPKLIKKNDFKTMASLLNLAFDYRKQYMSQSIVNSHKQLLGKLDLVKTGEGSALGSGLIVSAGLASRGIAGSKVVLCTDGFAHDGLGQIQGMARNNQSFTRDFYSQIGKFAQDHGIVLSLISLVDSGSRMDILSPIANLTYGDIMRIDSAKSDENLSLMTSKKIIATSVNVKMRLHKALEFLGVNQKALSMNNSLLALPIGNTTKDSQITFEYGIKPFEILNLIPNLSLPLVCRLPFQAQIEFKSMDGSKFMMVMTKMLEVSNVLNDAMKGAKLDVIQTHALQSSANLAERKSYIEAEKNMQRWRNFSVSPEQLLKFDTLTLPLCNAIEKQKTRAIGYPTELEQSDDLAIEMNKANRQILVTKWPIPRIENVPHPLILPLPSPEEEPISVDPKKRRHKSTKQKTKTKKKKCE